jgi:hypothetical protein
MSLHCRSALADRIELADQRVGGIDLVVSIRANEQQVLQIGAGQQIFEQIECCCIQPLQVIEEERKRMFRSCEHADETPKDQLKTSLRFLRRKLRNGWLLANDVLSIPERVR